MEPQDEDQYYDDDNFHEASDEEGCHHDGAVPQIDGQEEEVDRLEEMTRARLALYDTLLGGTQPPLEVQGDWKQHYQRVQEQLEQQEEEDYELQIEGQWRKGDNQESEERLLPTYKKGSRQKAPSCTTTTTTTKLKRGPKKASLTSSTPGNHRHRVVEDRDEEPQPLYPHSLHYPDSGDREGLPVGRPKRGNMTFTTAELMGMERENHRLLDRMVHIHRRAVEGTFSVNNNYLRSHHVASNLINRKKQAREIQRENQMMACRLEHVKSTVPRGKGKASIKSMAPTFKKAFKSGPQLIQPEWQT